MLIVQENTHTRSRNKWSVCNKVQCHKLAAKWSWYTKFCKVSQHKIYTSITFFLNKLKTLGPLIGKANALVQRKIDSIASYISDSIPILFICLLLLAGQILILCFFTLYFNFSSYIFFLLTH